MAHLSITGIRGSFYLNRQDWTIVVHHHRYHIYTHIPNIPGIRDSFYVNRQDWTTPAEHHQKLYSLIPNIPIPGDNGQREWR